LRPGTDRPAATFLGPEGLAGRVDVLDIRIVRAMGARPYGRTPKDASALKPADLARAVGTSLVTVKERIARMEESGFIRGYQVYPNLTHLGLAASAFRFRVPDADRKARAVQDIQLLDGLLEVHDFLGADVCIDLAYATQGERERKLGLLRAHTGDAAPLALYEREMPPVDRPLTNLDWRILQAMRGRARRAPDEVADEIGVSAKTVRRHHERMMEEGSFLAVPLLDPGRASGLFPFLLNFHTGPHPARATVETILQAYEERRIHTYFPVDAQLGNVGLMLFATSAAEVEDLRARGETLAGTQRVTAWVFRAFLDYSAWLDDAIAARVKATAAT